DPIPTTTETLSAASALRLRGGAVSPDISRKNTATSAATPCSATRSKPCVSWWPRTRLKEINNSRHRVLGTQQASARKPSRNAVANMQDVLEIEYYNCSYNIESAEFRRGASEAGPTGRGC